MSAINRLSIRSKIITGYALVVILLGAALLTLMGRVSSLQREIAFVGTHDIAVHDMTGQLEKDMLDMETGQRGYIITGEESYLAPYSDAQQRWNEDFAKLNGLIADNPSQQAKLEQTRTTMLDWMREAGDYSISLKRQSKESELDAFFAADPGKIDMDRIRAQIGEFRDTETALTAARIAKLDASNRSLSSLLLLVWIAVGVLCVLTGGFIARSIVRTITQVSRTIDGIAASSDNLSGRIEIASRDEVGELGQATNRLLDKLETERLAQTRIAEMATMLQEQTDLNALARTFLAHTAELLEVPYAVLYRRQDDGLKALAAFAGGIDEGAENAAFRIGEGVVGQAVLENRTVTVRSLPDDYVRIRSGIGHAAPRELTVVPVAFERRIVAALEVASFEPLTEDRRALLEQFARLLGVTFHAVASRMEIEQLYAESQTFNEELQAQSEELNAQSAELLAINEQLEQSSGYKSEFLANMSHELRTPLNSMLILSQILMENTRGSLTTEEVGYVRTIHAAGRDLLSLINDILDLSKVEAGKLDIDIAPVGTADLADAMEGFFRQTAEQKRLGFRIETASGVPAYMQTDGFRLEQIVKNLLSNAFKFTEKGEVRLSISRAASAEVLSATGSEPEADYVKYEVADTGIGIPPEKLGMIFEAFTQADGGTARRHGGTGLGLSISSRLAGLLGGFLTVTSRPGAGSAFALYLPIRGREALTDGEAAGPAARERAAMRGQAAAAAEFAVSAAGAGAQEEPSWFRGKRVLIVDDDVRNVFALTSILEKVGIEIHTAHDGRECLETLGRAEVDLVLMDIMMPDMDGYDTMRILRHNPAYAKLPIIALTAKAMKQDRERCLEAGASDYISKPVNTEQLLSLMRVWLSAELSDPVAE